VAIACRNPSTPDVPERFFTLLARAGDVRTGAAGSVLAEPLTVVVTDSVGTPVRGVPVSFRLVSGRGAVLLDSLLVSDAQGGASTQLRLGAAGDTAVVLAAFPGRDGGGVRFVAVAMAAAALTRVEPARVAGGDTVVVRGRGLGQAADGIVLFGTARARVVGPLDDSAVRVIVPACLPMGEVAVTALLAGATTNAVPVTVAEPERALALQQLEAATSPAGESAACVRLPGDGARYLIFPQFANPDDLSTASRPYALTVDGAVEASGLLVEREHPATGRDAAPTRPATVRERFERTLRRNEGVLAREGIADEAEALLRTEHPRRAAHSAADLAPLGTGPAPEPPALGSERSFRVLSRLDVSSFASTVGRLRYAGAHVLVYEDRAAPEPLDPAALQRLGDLFDRTLYELGVTTFGAESDIDGNGRVIVYLTPVVNALTTSAQCGRDGFVRGFFFGTDLGTRSLNSNRSEILYGLVPDAAGTRSCAHSAGEVLEQLPTTFIHEFQHMISFNQKVIVRRGREETTWLNEGLSHTAEELAGRLFERRYPAPLGRFSQTQLLPDSALPFYRGDIENAGFFLSAPAAHSITSPSELGTLEERGAAWLFVRWLAAQKGEDVLGRLARSPRTGRRNVEEVTGEPFAALFADFVIALSADSLPGVARSRVPARYQFGGRPLRELLTRGLARNTRWPLVARPAPPVGAAALGSMVPGTFDVYDLTVARGRGVALRFATPAGGPFAAAAGAQLGVLRLTP
jgi:hypothetical protein